MKEPGPFGESLPEGVELTLGELQEMACRQQHQIDSQHQLLVAKEQRLRFLKQQESRQHQVSAENERLRRLRDRVEAQELKLRKLRALRGQVDQNKLNNASLTSDLDSIRALFNEKEKELSLAVAKVDELTRQLEELKRGRGVTTRDQQAPSPAALELDKLRRELMYRNKLNEQQNARLCQQREALTQRQEEMSSIDKRISELQDRLHRKRLLNQQLANQITAASNKASGQQQLRSTTSSNTIQQHQYQQEVSGKGKLLRPLTSGNIAAIEPYHHVPVGGGSGLQSGDVEKPVHRHQVNPTEMFNAKQSQSRGDGGPASSYHKQMFQQPDGMSSQDHKHSQIHQDRIVSQDDFHAKLISGGVTSGSNGSSHSTNISGNSKNKEDQYLPEFGGSKSDPKYQTLPYNTKFTVNFVSSTGTKVGSSGSDKQDAVLGDDARKNIDTNDSTKNNNNNNNNVNSMNNNNNMNNPTQQQLMTVHSIPIPALSGVNKGLAMPFSNQAGTTAPNKITASSTPHLLGHIGPRPFGSSVGHSTSVNSGFQPGLTRGQPVGGTSSTTSSTSSLATNSSASSSGSFQKPISSVAPTSMQHQKPSPIYQSSSTKIHPVQPQTLNSTPQGILRDLRGELSPPQSTSTPLGTPEMSALHDARLGKPALPPKPALPVKPTPPPRQTQHCVGMENGVDTSVDAVDSAINVLRGTVTSSIRGGFSLHQDHTLTKLGQQQLHHIPLTSAQPVIPLNLESEDKQLQSSSLVPPCPPPPPPTSEPPEDTTCTNLLGSQRQRVSGVGANADQLPIIKARPLTIKKQPASEHPKLKSVNIISGQSGGSVSVNNNSNTNGVHVSINRRIEMPPAFLFPETEAPPADLISSGETPCLSNSTNSTCDEFDREITTGSEADDNVRAPALGEESNHLQKPEETKMDVAIVDALNNINLDQQHPGETMAQHIMRKTKKGNLKVTSSKGSGPAARRVSFDPLALLLDASLEGELELVKKTAGQVTNPSAANDEGITALHNAICAGHLDIVKFLVEFGCNVNAQDSDGWTPLHCAASCNNLAMVRFLVEHGACIFATTLSDHETAAEKCEEDEEGFDGCSEYLYSVQEKLGILNNGVVFAVYDYDAQNSDELGFKEGDKMVVLRKGDEWEREWWWSRLTDQEGYIPRNLLGLYPRVLLNKKLE